MAEVTGEVTPVIADIFGIITDDKPIYLFSNTLYYFSHPFFNSVRLTQFHSDSFHITLSTAASWIVFHKHPQCNQN